MRKVVMVTGPVHPVPPIKGAAVETWIYEVSKRLMAFEPHIVSISHPFYPEREYRDGIYFHRIRLGRLYRRLFQKMTKLDPLSYERRIMRVIDEVGPDIVHIHNYAPGRLIEGLRKKGIKTVLHMHNEREIGRLKVDLFLGCSNYITDFYLKKGTVEGRFEVVYNGVDLERFRPLWEVEDLRRRVRERFDVGEDDFVVLYVGRVSPEKGVEHLLEAASLLDDRDGIRFFLVGEVSREGRRGEYGRRIVERAGRLKGRVVITGVFPPSRIHLLYLLGDAVVIPSNFEEPFGMVALEAMATGLPVIARRKGGLVEYIRHGENGLFIGEEDLVEGLLGVVRLLREERGLRLRIGEAGRRTVEGFSWERIATRLEGLYMERVLRP